jgi:glycerophosphoryl diester phosphodiesterase
MRGREEELAELVVATVSRQWKYQLGTQRLYFSSSAERCLKVLHELMPEIPRSLSLHYVPRDPAGLAAATHSQILHVKAAFLTEAELDRIASTDLEWGAATVNDKQRAQFLLERGIQSVISDDPNLLGD